MLEIAYFQILGKPLMFWLGIFSLSSLLITFSLPFLRRKWPRIPFKAHKIFAFITLALALIHGVIAASVYF